MSALAVDTAATSSESEGTLPVRSMAVLVVVGLGLFMAFLDATIVYISLPAMMQELRVPLTTISWVVHAYNLLYATVLVTGGRLADRYARGRLYALAVALFAGSSIACMLPLSPHPRGGRRSPVWTSGGLLRRLFRSPVATVLAAGLVIVGTACAQGQPTSLPKVGTRSASSVPSVKPSTASRSVSLPDACSLVSSSDIRAIFGLDMTQAARPATRECAYTGHLVAPGGGHECDCTITLRVQPALVRSREAVRQTLSGMAPLVEIAEVGDAAFLSSSAYGLCCVTVVKDGVQVDFGPVGTPVNIPLGAMDPAPRAGLEVVAKLIASRIP